jgi:hypothetical protein
MLRYIKSNEGEALAASTSKKVLIQRFDRDSLPGFVNPRTCFLQNGVELITTSGTVAVIPYDHIKLVSFVRDFDSGGTALERRTFQSRPKTAGLWLRMQFRDGDTLEGLHPNNLLLMEPYGFTVTPPDPSANEQRIFIPRAALSEIQAVGVIGGSVRRQKPRKPAKEQLEMFD